MIIEKILGKIEEINTENKTIHTVEMTDIEMEKGHQRTRTKDGIELGISLQDDVQMSHGDVLYCDETDVVVVYGTIQKVFALYPETAKEWGKVCYNIGNMHQKAYLTECEVIVPYDYVLEGVIEKLGVHFHIEERIIKGEKANISAKIHKGGHHHHH